MCIWTASTIKSLHDQNSQFAAYRAGQLDMTDTVPSNAIESLRKGHPQELVIAPLLATAYYGLNLEAPEPRKQPQTAQSIINGN